MEKNWGDTPSATLKENPITMIISLTKMNSFAGEIRAVW